MNTIRIGFIGAGGIARNRHLPGLASIDGAEVVAVCNRTAESSRRVASEWNIPRIETNWRAIAVDPEIDAVFIGTWPYMHAEISIAALAAGRHVFCQARMAMDLNEAKAMTEAARRRPELVNMICPPPTRMPYEPFIRRAIDEVLGPVISVELVVASGGNRNPEGISWREDVRYSGRQIMAVGIHAETLNAWLGPYRELSARFSTPIPAKSVGGREVPVRIPQVATITGALESGALVTEHHTGLAADKTSRGAHIVIRGMAGTLRYQFASQTLEIAGPDEELRPAVVSEELTRPWRVEQDFIEAVRAAERGEPWSVSPDFAEGLLYMRKMEAIHRSAESGQAVKPAEL